MIQLNKFLSKSIHLNIHFFNFKLRKISIHLSLRHNPSHKNLGQPLSFTDISPIFLSNCIYKKRVISKCFGTKTETPLWYRNSTLLPKLHTRYLNEEMRVHKWKDCLLKHREKKNVSPITTYMVFMSINYH